MKKMNYGRLSVVEDSERILEILDKSKKRVETRRDKAKATRKDIIALISEKKALTKKEIQAQLNHSVQEIKYNITVLRNAGLLRRVDNLREMSNPLYALTKKGISV